MLCLDCVCIYHRLKIYPTVVDVAEDADLAETRSGSENENDEGQSLSGRKVACLGANRNSDDLLEAVSESV